MKKILIYLCILGALLPTAALADNYSGENLTDSYQNGKRTGSYFSENLADTLPEAEAAKIHAVIAACADIMSFDIKDYDYDTLFKYVLYTHQNFRILTDIPAGSGSSSTVGYNSVSIVRSDYIDHIMNSVFCVPPEKPPSNALLERGFCYNDGYYYYTGGFDVYFATRINDIIGVYDMDGGVMLVVFTDTYSEGDTDTTERSFAVLQKNPDSYSLLRLGMGKNPPAGEEIAQYAASPEPDAPPQSTDASELTMSAMLLLIAAGVIAFPLALIALIRQIRK